MIDDTISEDAPPKRCSGCSNFKPATTEYFSRHKKEKDGLNSQCKECNRRYRANNKERKAEYARKYHAANRERELARMKTNYTANKQRRIDRARDYRSKNKDKVSQSLRRYRAVNSKRITEYNHKYHAANKEREREQQRQFRIANREQLKQHRRELYAANKEHFRRLGRIKANRRRALKHAAGGNHTDADVKRQYKSQHGKCYYCAQKISGTFHVDHIKPLSRGGSNGPENIVIACPFCNDSKGAKLPHEWSQGGKLL